MHAPRIPLLVCTIAVGLWLGTSFARPATPTTDAEENLDILYDVRLCTSEKSAAVEIRVEQESGQLRALRFEIPDDRMRAFEGDGEISIEERELTWEPPAAGGVLRYEAVVDHLREPAEYDARCTDDWALLRGTDLVPLLRATLSKDAVARTRLRFRLPADWRVVTPFERLSSRTFRIERSGRTFDTPRGWMMAGDLRLLRAQIGPTSVTLASPAGQATRDRDRLALLRWTLPTLREILGDHAPRRLLIVSADDPMWRGALSGPDSLFLHADRPLIASDGTSPLLHELIHVAMSANSGEGGDWIVEGLAELYSIELLRRSGTISTEEWEETLATIRDDAAEADSLRVRHAQSDTTDRAILVLRALDQRIQSATQGESGLDEVLRRLAARSQPEPLTLKALQAEAEAVAGASLAEFFSKQID